MLDRALLALADERSSGQDYGEHGEIVDDLHHRVEPARLQVRVELCAGHDLDRGKRVGRPRQAPADDCPYRCRSHQSRELSCGARHQRAPCFLPRPCLKAPATVSNAKVWRAIMSSSSVGMM